MCNPHHTNMCHLHCQYIGGKFAPSEEKLQDTLSNCPDRHYMGAQVEGLASNAMGGLSKLQNLSITLQRRWSNVLSDAQRQHIVELFLGLRLPTYLPSAQPLYSATSPLEVGSCNAET